ncbi:MAG: formylglycine-generating enzyme family protein, partial [bacterium]|nr:formylglycine-generating enzyme family protein [bacterium]
WGYAGDTPVIEIICEILRAYVMWLSQKTGTLYFLPPEAEWEFAARGGNLSKGYLYSGSDDINAVAWYRKNSESRPNPVATKQPNELGLYDMSGNAPECCGGLHRTNKGVIRMLRGGSWFANEFGTRASGRISVHPFDDRNTSPGFRLLYYP